MKHIQKDRNGSAAKTFVGFDDCEANLKRTSTDTFSSHGLWIPNERKEANIRIKSVKYASAIREHSFSLF